MFSFDVCKKIVYALEQAAARWCRGEAVSDGLTEALVIIPAYNATATIRETIESVVEQPVADNISIEIIVCDDCSTDDTRKLVELR